jgi:hypothetical protein
MASVSDFNSKRGFMVRSEGGRIYCDFNNLRRWIKSLGAFPAYRCLSVLELNWTCTRCYLRQNRRTYARERGDSRRKEVDRRNAVRPTRVVRPRQKSGHRPCSDGVDAEPMADAGVSPAVFNQAFSALDFAIRKAPLYSAWN